jgi:NAD(P)-dependent dehydrogenase (short-subunit alcohol dehydrogenase family)
MVPRHEVRTMRLKDKVALITGAGMGMGREAAVTFAKEGAKVALFDLNGDAARETAAQVEALGGQSAVIEGDVADEDAVKGAVAQAVGTFGGLHVLYANAGVLWKDRDKSVIETDAAEWDRVQAINLRGPFLLTKHGIPALREAGGGSIILVGSISAVVGFELAQDSYTAAKSALIGLTKSLAVQFGPDGIRCNIIHPGIIETPMQDPYLTDDSRAGIAQSLPLRRLGKARDIAQTALFLASDESSFMTGAELVVDGGFLAT